MFKPARWWSEKNRIKVVFKLQFHASQVGDVGGDGLIISVVPGDTGKASVKSEKAAVRDGSCLWENPVHETVKFIRDPKSGKIHQRIYHLLVGTGSSKSPVVGEASIDLSSYAEASKASLLSLPLKNSKSKAILNVSIQRVHESMDQREIEENDNANLHSEVSSQLGDHDVDGAIRNSPIEEAPLSKAAPLERALLVSSGSDTTLSSSGSSSGLETPWKMQIKNENNNEPIGFLSTPGPKSDTPSPEPHQKSWEWLRDPDLEEEGPDIVIERLKDDVSALSRQVEMSDLELQSLRKQVAKESKRGQDLWREVVMLKEERDGLKGECERLKSKSKSNLMFDGVESQVVQELRQELNHAKELNANLHIQLQKIQESNSELILAVRDLEEMVEQKNDEREVAIADDEDDDEEQKALDDIVKEHSEIEDLQTEIEIYKREKDELEMQMEQLALDYEIMKQANHNMACKLEQSQIQEHLNMQYESSSSADDHEIEFGNRIESLENELQTRMKEYEDSLVLISKLQSHVESLEKEVEKQARGYEADVEALTRSKVEQEQRAIRAEEAVKKMRWKNANAAERLQNEFKKLSAQMASTFEANEKLATNAIAEANELRLQKSHLEKMLRKISEEHHSAEGYYVARLEEVSSQVTLMSSQIVQLESDIKEREVRMEDQKRQGEETRKLLYDEISVLKEEIEEHIAKNEILLEDLRSKEVMMNEVEKLKLSVKELELVVEQGNDEKIEAENRVILMKKETEELAKELDKMRCLVKEKELAAVNLQSELDSLRAQCSEMKHDEKEKESFRKQVLQLRSDLKKKEDAIKSLEKKTRDGNGRAMTVDAVKGGPKTRKPSPRGSMEVANLKERIKLLEGEIKVKENALEKSANEFLEREEVLHKKIEALEDLCKVENPAAELKDQACNKGRLSEEAGNVNENSSATSTTSSVYLSRKSNDVTDEEQKNEMGLLIEKNKSMERDLKEMQERYSDMSLKFAEVEGERQQLVMKLRGLVNAKKSPHSTNLFAPVYW